MFDSNYARERSKKPWQTATTTQQKTEKQ